jgi:Na+/H+ antiporter NhaC
MKLEKNKGHFKALIPLFIFVFSFLGAGIYLNDFYALPSPIAVILGILAAFFLFQDSMDSKIQTFLEGCGDSKIITMCLIYLLAGAFAMVCKATESVEAIVNFGLDYISIEYIYLGVFLIAAFLSISTGTSVGSIVALCPIIVEISEKTALSLPVLSGALLGGAMFGDNLSVISDTTIAATQSLNCKMSDKFKQNIKIALPAALLTMAILFFQGYGLNDTGLVLEKESYSLIKIAPYLLVIVFSVLGWNVFLVLFLGIISAGVIGLSYGDFSILEFAKATYEGFGNMTEIFLLSMFTGGLAALTSKNGGIDFILYRIDSLIKSKKTAQYGIATLVSLVNMAIANNTVSIIITGDVTKNINDTYELDNKKTASILDIFACISQGVLPYGAQVLIILSFSKEALNYIDLISNTWYLAFLLVVTLLSIAMSNLFEKKAI